MSHATSGSPSPQRGNVPPLLLPWPSPDLWSQLVTLHNSSVPCSRSPQPSVSADYIVESLHPDQGALAGLVALDAKTSFSGVDWMMVHGTDVSLPQPHDCCCRRFSTPPVPAMTSPNIQHRNTERFRQAFGANSNNGPSVGILDSGHSSATSIFRSIREHIVTSCSRSIDNISERSSAILPSHFDSLLTPSITRRRVHLSPIVAAPPAAALTRHRTDSVVGIFIGGHVDDEGNVMCLGGTRFTPTALVQAVEQGVAAANRVALARGGRVADRIAPPIVICFGLCRGGNRWSEEMRGGGRVSLVIDSPLWGAGVLGGIPPSQRKSFKTLFSASIPLFMEATVSMHKHPLNVWGREQGVGPATREGVVGLFPRELIVADATAEDHQKGKSPYGNVLLPPRESG